MSFRHSLYPVPSFLRRLGVEGRCFNRSFSSVHPLLHGLKGGGAGGGRSGGQATGSGWPWSGGAAAITMAVAGARTGAWDGGRALFSPLPAPSLHRKGLGDCAAGLGRRRPGWRLATGLVAVASGGRVRCSAPRPTLPWTPTRGRLLCRCPPNPAQIMVLAERVGIGIGQPSTNLGFG
jgi:hypothetical protein